MPVSKIVVTLVLSAALLATLPASANARLRPDPLGYSGLFWPNYAIWGRTVSKQTKFGVLVCSGAGVRGSRSRSCHWK